MPDKCNLSFLKFTLHDSREEGFKQHNYPSFSFYTSISLRNMHFAFSNLAFQDLLWIILILITQRIVCAWYWKVYCFLLYNHRLVTPCSVSYEKIMCRLTVHIKWSLKYMYWLYIFMRRKLSVLNDGPLWSVKEISFEETVYT